MAKIGDDVIGKPGHDVIGKPGQQSNILQYVTPKFTFSDDLDEKKKVYQWLVQQYGDIFKTLGEVRTNGRITIHRKIDGRDLYMTLEIASYPGPYDKEHRFYILIGNVEHPNIYIKDQVFLIRGRMASRVENYIIKKTISQADFPEKFGSVFNKMREEFLNIASAREQLVRKERKEAEAFGQKWGSLFSKTKEISGSSAVGEIGPLDVKVEQHYDGTTSVHIDGEGLDEEITKMLLDMLKVFKLMERKKK